MKKSKEPKVVVPLINPTLKNQANRKKHLNMLQMSLTSKNLKKKLLDNMD